MHKKLLIGLFVILALPVLLSGCGEPEPSASLDGTEWVLTSLNGDSPLQGTEITLAFDDGEASGSAGCNTYFGPYTVDGAGGLTFHGLANTEMACLEPEGIMEQETEYLQTLRSATRYTVTDGQLEILADGGGVLVYRRAP
ncbi:MAG: META domain-containing protein [Anaerolineae bacterium]|nr:META domain-containing protein [Anaerolineae bacterium]NIN95826.1 META domain-containing protein [Anaerolineae bacterium]NIQ78792.1 META domain-containing protein [Anaerolineae bacterium]